MSITFFILINLLKCGINYKIYIFNVGNCSAIKKCLFCITDILAIYIHYFDKMFSYSDRFGLVKEKSLIIA